MSSSPRRARADAPADARERRPSPATAPWGSACQQRAPPLQTAPPPRSAGPPPPPPEEAAAAAAFWTSLRLEGRTVSGRRRASSGPSLGTSRTSRLGCGSAQRTRPGPAVAPAHEKARNLLHGARAGAHAHARWLASGRRKHLSDVFGVRACGQQRGLLGLLAASLVHHRKLHRASLRGAERELKDRRRLYVDRDLEELARCQVVHTRLHAWRRQCSALVGGRQRAYCRALSASRTQSKDRKTQDIKVSVCVLCSDI